MRSIARDLGHELGIGGYAHSLRRTDVGEWSVADAISMHESTVSRVTSNKYMMTPRGLFELKYFFSASIATTTGREAHSAEAVRFRIRQMIDRETPENILSDDAIVARLKAADIDIARRTVAKYREQLNIPVARLRKEL